MVLVGTVDDITVERLETESVVVATVDGVEVMRMSTPLDVPLEEVTISVRADLVFKGEAGSAGTVRFRHWRPCAGAPGARLDVLGSGFRQTFVHFEQGSTYLLFLKRDKTGEYTYTTKDWGVVKVDAPILEKVKAASAELKGTDLVIELLVMTLETRDDKPRTALRFLDTPSFAERARHEVFRERATAALLDVLVRTAEGMGERWAADRLIGILAKASSAARAGQEQTAASETRRPAHAECEVNGRQSHDDTAATSASRQKPVEDGRLGASAYVAMLTAGAIVAAGLAVYVFLARGIRRTPTAKEEPPQGKQTENDNSAR